MGRLRIWPRLTSQALQHYGPDGRLAALAKWEKRPSPQKNASGNVAKGRGISYVKYELGRTYIGAVAEVEVDRRTGVIRVPKFTLVQDCGQIINPDSLKNQLEGMIQTVSRTLIEEVKFDRSQVTRGAGEPAAAVIPSAISSAVFDATGVRLRSIPCQRAYSDRKVARGTRRRGRAFRTLSSQGRYDREIPRRDRRPRLRNGAEARRAGGIRATSCFGRDPEFGGKRQMGRDLHAGRR